MSTSHPATPELKIVDGDYPCFMEITGLPFKFSVVVAATDLDFSDFRDRTEAMERICKTWNAHDDLVRALRAATLALDHDTPGSCWATGPLTGDPYEDLVVCPGCRAIHAIQDALAKAGAAWPT